MFDVLTKGAEALLQEILNHRKEGVVDTTYFFKKLEEMDYSEEELYRSCFKELSNYGLVITRWADNGPYMISLTSAGLEYFGHKETVEKKKQKERRSSRWHDIGVAAIGAIFGGIVTFLLFKLFGIS